MDSFDLNLFGNSEHTTTRISELIRMVCLDESEDWNISMHSHEDCCEWEYVAEGEGQYLIDFREYPIQKGDLICINKGVNHAETSSSAHPLKSYKLTLRLRPAGSLAADMVIPSDYEPVIHCGSAADDLQACCEQLYTELMSEEKFYEAMVMLVAERYYILVRRAWEKYGTRIPERKKNLAAEVKHYLNIHYREHITLDSLEKKIHADKYHIAHEMKKNYGISPINYLIDRRIGEAQHLLNTTDMTVGEIARMVGYDNVSYFAILFRKKTGMTPTSFRDRYVRK